MDKTAAEFFAGIGLMRVGLESAGWKVLWANDIDPDKVEIYRGHFRDSPDHLDPGDVHQISASSIPSVSLATASFPCTDLSLAGARRGLAGEHSGAFWGFIDAIKAMGRRRPKLILLENVPGFLTSHDGEDFRDACLALNDLGYAVDALLIDAAHFVPQSRSRLFVIGKRTKARDSLNDTAAFYSSPCRPAALADFIMWNPEIRWDLRDLPPLPARTSSLEDILEDIPANSSVWWSPERASYLLNQMSERHRALADSMIAGKRVTYGTVFRRVRNGRSMAELRTDGIAGCLRTPRGGSGRQILFAAGRGRYGARLLTPRECGRLMGVDEYKLGAKITLNQALFGFGDAVCVPVIQWITENYLTPVLEEMHGAEKENAC